MFRHVIWYGIVLLLLLLMAACGNDDLTNSQNMSAEENQKQDEEQEDVSEADEQGSEDAVAPYTAPLTGLGSDEQLDHRPFAVSVNNHNRARPQSGLQEADIVYEVLAEGSITRFMALYHSEIPEVLGPVRSLRPYYIDLVEGVDPVFAHAGGSPQAMDYIGENHLPSLDDTRNGGLAFYRADFRDAPHNLYSGKELLQEALQNFQYDKKVDIPSLTFKDEEGQAGTEVGQFEIEYHSSNRVSYEYDEQSKAYTRFAQGEPHLDLESEKPLMMENVLVVETRHNVLDDAGRRDIDVQGEGEAYLFQQGLMHKVDWKHENGLIRAFQDGEEVGLVPGKTWVNVIPDHPGLEGQVHIAESSS